MIATTKPPLPYPLTPRKQRNDSNHETAFTISIDAKEAKTGISAYERDLTIRLMCDNNAKPSDFVRPGHIFPLIAKSGGTLIRTGHTEASVDICRLSGLAPISVICEIMKKDGTMAGRGDKFLLDFAKTHNLKILYVSDIIQYRLNFENLVRETSREKAVFMAQECDKFLLDFAKTHNLKILYVSDIIQYRLNFENLVRETSREKAVFMAQECEKITFLDHLENEHIALYVSDIIQYRLNFENLVRETSREKAVFMAQECEKITFLDHLENEHIAFSFSPQAQTPLIRFHSTNSDITLLTDSNEWQALQKSIELLSQQGGYLICLDTAAKNVASGSIAKNCGDIKDFGIGAQILKTLGVKDFTLLSSHCANNANKSYNALSGFDLHLQKSIEV